MRAIVESLRPVYASNNQLAGMVTRNKPIHASTATLAATITRMAETQAENACAKSHSQKMGSPR